MVLHTAAPCLVPGYSKVTYLCIEGYYLCAGHLHSKCQLCWSSCFSASERYQPCWDVCVCVWGTSFLFSHLGNFPLLYSAPQRINGLLSVSQQYQQQTLQCSFRNWCKSSVSFTQPLQGSSTSGSGCLLHGSLFGPHLKDPVLESGLPNLSVSLSSSQLF